MRSDHLLFTWREYDPLSAVIAERGPITAADAIALFRGYDWAARQQAMDKADPKDIHYSPGFEITDSAQRTLYIGGVGGNTDFMVGYIRPKLVRKLTLLGFKEKLDPKHYTDAQISGAEQVEALLNAFLEGRVQEVEERIG